MDKNQYYIIKNIGMGPTLDFFAISVADSKTNEISYGLIRTDESIKRGDYVKKINYQSAIDDILGNWELANQFRFKNLYKKTKSVKTKSYH